MISIGRKFYECPTHFNILRSDQSVNWRKFDIRKWIKTTFVSGFIKFKQHSQYMWVKSSKETCFLLAESASKCCCKKSILCIYFIQLVCAIWSLLRLLRVHSLAGHLYNFTQIWFYDCFRLTHGVFTSWCRVIDHSVTKQNWHSYFLKNVVELWFVEKKKEAIQKDTSENDIINI